MNGIRIGSWNCRGIRNKKLDLKRSLLEQEKIDILGIQESKLNKSDSLVIDGFNIFRDRSRENENIIIIYKKNIKITEIRNIQNEKLRLDFVEIS